MSTGPRRRPGHRTLCGAALATILSVACNTHTLEQPPIKPDRVGTFSFQESLNRKIDILFMIDDSISMKPSQDNLLRNFPAFMQVLDELPGGLPDVHIAVVSSDMGAG